MSRHAPSKIRPGWQDERHLMTRVKSEDEKALERFTHAHGAGLYRLAFRLVGDEERALQILSAGLTKAIKRSAFRDESEELDAWLTGFILREAMPAPARSSGMMSTAPEPGGDADNRKGRGRKGQGHRSQAAGGSATPATAPGSNASDPPAVVDWSPLLENEESRQTLRQRLLLAASRLPMDLRSAWILMDAEGRSVEKCAAAMELDEQTTLSRAHRARMTLCLSLAPVNGEQKETS